MPQQLQRELAALLTGQVAAPVVQGYSVDYWHALVQQAHQDGVAPPLAHSLRQVGSAAQIPPALWQQLHGSYLATQVENMLRYRALVALLAGLPATADAPLPIILLKGADLALTVYADPGLRRMSDLDLLVPPTARRDLLRVCQQAGLQRVEMQPGLEQITGQVQLGGGSYLLAMDLHWQLIGGEADRRSPPLDWFLAQTAPLRLPASDLTVLHLSPTANLLYLAAHLMLRHGGEMLHLRWIYDLHLLISDDPAAIDWRMLYRQAVAYGWAGSLHAALAVAADLFGTALPAGYLAGLAVVSAGERSLHQLQQLPQTQTTRAWHTLLGLTWRGRLRLLGALLLPSQEYLRWRYALDLPANLHWLYYPYRWLDVLRDVAHTGVRLIRTQMQRSSPCGRST